MYIVCIGGDNVAFLLLTTNGAIKSCCACECWYGCGTVDDRYKDIMFNEKVK